MLRLGFRRLASADWVTKSDPLAVVKARTGESAEWQRLGQTEHVNDATSGTWEKTICIKHAPDKNQQIKVQVYDYDPISGNDLIGTATFLLGQVFAACVTEEHVFESVLLKGREKRGFLTVRLQQDVSLETMAQGDKQEKKKQQQQQVVPAAATSSSSAARGKRPGTASLSTQPNKARIAGSETQKGELERIASEMTCHDIKEMLKSRLIQRAMANLGYGQDDVLAERQETRFKMAITPTIKKHLERRRIEALANILAERQSLVAQRKKETARPQTAPQRQRYPHGNAEEEPCKHRIRDPVGFVHAELAKRVERQARYNDKLVRLQDFEKRRAQRALDKLSFVQSKLDEKLQAAEQRKQERQNQTRAKLQAKLQANARAKAVRNALIQKRKEDLRLRAKLVEDRLVKTQALKTSLSDLRSESVASQDPNVARTVAAFAAREAHRAKVKEDAKRRQEDKKEQMVRQRQRKTAQAQQTQKKLIKKACAERDRRKMAEVDRILKLERLHRQELHRKIVSQKKVDKKMAISKALDEASDTLLVLKSQVDRESIIKKDEIKRKKPLVVTPGPGEYEISSGLSELSFSLGNADPKEHEERKMEQLRESPGPGDYSADKNLQHLPAYLRPGVSFSKSDVPGEIDWIIKRSAEIPGPSYSIKNTIGADAPAFKFADLPCQDLKNVRAKIFSTTPGPAHYRPKS